MNLDVIRKKILAFGVDNTATSKVAAPVPQEAEEIVKRPFVPRTPINRRPSAFHKKRS